MAAILALGPCTFQFEEVGGSGSPIVISQTNEDEDTTLTTEIENFQIKADQALGPILERIANINATLNCTVFLDYETLAALCPEWEKGSTGFALGGIGAVAKKFKLTIKPLGSTEAAEWIIAPSVTVSSSMNLGFKKNTAANVPLTITLSSDETASSSTTFGKVLATGNYAKVSQ